MRILNQSLLPRSIETTMREVFPDKCAQLGESECSRLVNEAVRRGRQQGFEDAQLPAYVSLEFCFGPDFGVDEKYRDWAGRDLEDRTSASQERMQRLRTAAIRYLIKAEAGGEE